MKTDTPFSIIDKITRQKIRLKQFNKPTISNIHVTVHLTTIAYTFFLRSHGTFSRVDSVFVRPQF